MIKRKAKEWIKRYLPSEIVGTITALGSAGIAHYYNNNGIFVAYMGSLGEAIGFYSTVLIQNILIREKRNKELYRKFHYSDLLATISSIVLEFGPAGLLDGLLLRPFFMYLFPVLLTNFSLGIIIGKLVGDISFYFLVILSYELKKRYSNRKVS